MNRQSVSIFSLHIKKDGRTIVVLPSLILIISSYVHLTSRPILLVLQKFYVLYT